MPQDDLASQWKSFDQEKRTRLLGKMSPEQKKILRSKLEAKPVGQTGTPPPQESTVVKVGRGAALGAFEGVGVAPAATAGGVISGTANQFKEGVENLVGDTWRANAGASGVPGGQLAATALDLIPTWFDKTADTLEQGGRQTVQDIKNKDWEGAAEHGTATLTAAALLRASREGEPKVPEKIAAKTAEVRKLQPFARKVTEVEPALKDAVTKAAEKHQTATAAYDTTKKLDQQSVALKGHIERVEKSVKAAADAKFDAVREKLGVTDENPGPAVKPDTLVATVKHATEQTLQNIPENVKEFNVILRSEGLPENVADVYRRQTGEEPEATEALTWSKLQSIKSRLDARLRKGIPNGNLYTAVRDVRDGVVNEMGSLAEEHGATAEWGEARNAWTQYKQDFHEPTGPSGSGSPVAQSLRAVDPKNIRDPFIRKQATTGNRGVDILNKYHEHGGREAAKAAGDLLETHGALSDLPKSGNVTRPPSTPVVDAAKVAREAIAKKARNWANFNARDIGILTSGTLGEFLGAAFGGSTLERVAGAAGGVLTYEGGKMAAGRALNRPAVIEWLSKTPQAELDVLAKIPGADKVKIVNAITSEAVKAKAPTLSRGVRDLIGPANVARIMAASGRKEKKPGEQLRDLRRIQEAHKSNPAMPVGP